MPRHLQREIENLKKKILHLSVVVEESVQNAIKAVENRDPKLGRNIIDHDQEIDQLEVDLEEEGLKILALHQPVAIDLRFIIAVLKINNDLERIGDLAVNIAERGVFLSGHRDLDIPPDILRMESLAQVMLRKSLDALVNLDSPLARDVCLSDDEVDRLHQGIFAKIHSEIRRRPEDLESLIQILSISRYLERIADHATNIAEDVVYMVEGKVIKHSPK